MAPAYKLTYFAGRGLAETARYLFSYGGIEYEDVRIEMEEWPQWKEKMSFGIIPVLEHNGKQVCQSMSIARYLAKKVNLAGKNDWEDLEIDSVVNTINDLYLKAAPLFDEKDETKKKALIETLTKETCPYYFARFEAAVQKNKGYIAVGRLTWADVYWATIAPMYELLIGQDMLGDYPNLKALREKVDALPAIKKWIQIRPETPW